MLLTSEQLVRIIVILLIVFIVILLIKKAIKFACFLFALLCLYHIGFILSHTDVNKYIPLDKYFKYDIVGSIISIWENDKDKIKEDITDGIENIIDKTEGIINKDIKEDERTENSE